MATEIKPRANVLVSPGCEDRASFGKWTTVHIKQSVPARSWDSPAKGPHEAAVARWFLAPAPLL